MLIEGMDTILRTTLKSLGLRCFASDDLLGASEAKC
jgi:hypothetical protein